MSWRSAPRGAVIEVEVGARAIDVPIRCEQSVKIRIVWSAAADAVTARPRVLAIPARWEACRNGVVQVVAVDHLDLRGIRRRLVEDGQRIPSVCVRDDVVVGDQGVQGGLEACTLQGRELP
eukprot:4155318-Prymnesium_polylepis.1